MHDMGGLHDQLSRELAVRELGFGDRARLLFTLPVARPARLQALLVLATLQIATSVGLALACLFAALAWALGAQAASWILLALAGMGIALWLVLVIQMTVTAAALPAFRRHAVATTAAGLVTAAGAAILLSGPGGEGIHAALSSPSPGVAALLAAVLLIAVGWPLAGAAGGLYEAAFFVQEAGVTRARPRRTLRRLTRAFAGRRGPTGALLVREVLIRGRLGVEWLRAGIFAAALLVGFPALRPTLAAHGLSGPLGICGAVVIVALLFIFDGSVSPLGAEGSRLLLFLTAPVSLGALLRAKLLALLLPLLCGGIVSGGVLMMGSGLAAAEVAWVLAAIGLVLAGVAVVCSFGSAWDADLEIEAGLRGYVQETAPTTVPRMLLFGLAAGVAAAELLLLARLTPLPGLLAVAAADALLLAALERPAESALRRLVREG